MELQPSARGVRSTAAPVRRAGIGLDRNNSRRCGGPAAAKRLDITTISETACALLRYIWAEVKDSEALCCDVMPLVQSRRSPNIYDVARHADVSVATVSAVVNSTAY